MMMNKLCIVAVLIIATVYSAPLASETKTPTPSEVSINGTKGNPASGAEEASGEDVAASGFSCEGRIFGYYGDTLNCSLFHYCEPFADPEKNQFVLHAAYLCPNETVFNQLSLTCTYANEALPCARAPEYYYINSHVVPAESGEDGAKEGGDSSAESKDSSSTTPEPTTTKKE